MKIIRKPYKQLLKLPKRDESGRIIPIYDSSNFIPIARERGTSMHVTYVATDKHLIYKHRDKIKKNEKKIGKHIWQNHIKGNNKLKHV